MRKKEGRTLRKKKASRNPQTNKDESGKKIIADRESQQTDNLNGEA